MKKDKLMKLVLMLFSFLKRNFDTKIVSTKIVIGVMAIVFNTSFSMAQTVINEKYDFESDTKLGDAADITEIIGNFLVADHPTEGRSLVGFDLGTGSDVAVAELDKAPAADDYYITWKETYIPPRKHGFMLRSQGVRTDRPGLKQGYFFMVNSVAGTVHILQSNTSDFNQLAEATLVAPGKNVPRWFRATATGNKLTLEYSDNGSDFTNILSVTDDLYPNAGTSQYVIGLGEGIRQMYVDDIVISNIKEINTNINPFVSNISPYQIIQRDNAGKAAIFIEGTYTGNATGIEARWNNDNVWTPLTMNSNANSFSGTLTSQSQGQGTLEVRFTNNTAIISSLEKVGIGDIYVIAGQSNASGRGNSLNSYSHPSLFATMYGNNYKWSNLTDPTDDPTGQVDEASSDAGRAAGSPWPLVATTIMAEGNIPVSFIPTARNGASILEWKPSTIPGDVTTLYGGMYNRIMAAGGKIKAVLYYQGENESNNNSGVSQATYEQRLNELANAIASDFGGAKIMVGQVGYSNRTGLDNVRGAQVSVANTNSNVLLGPATYDINLSIGGDGLHFKTDVHMQEFARRWSFAINKEFYGGTNGYGPIVNSPEIVYNQINNQITVPFTDDSSLINTVTSTVSSSSFTLINGNQNVAIEGVSILDNSVILQLSSGLDISKSIILTYASLNKGVNDVIYDNDNLPAQPFYNLNVNLDSSLSIKGSKVLEGVSVYPNPTSDRVKLLLNNLEKATISLFSLEGVLLQTMNVTNTKNVNIDLSNYAEGMYLIKVEQVDKNCTLKVFKF
ncbi:MAG: T9SS type A sorting domain-containing protein [Lutibacter sp.]|nr:T9SS type A sorting domain-containing protein [Lutibacter sp.]